MKFSSTLYIHSSLLNMLQESKQRNRVPHNAILWIIHLMCFYQSSHENTKIRKLRVEPHKSELIYNGKILFMS